MLLPVFHLCRELLFFEIARSERPYFFEVNLLVRWAAIFMMNYYDLIYFYIELNEFQLGAVILI